MLSKLDTALKLGLGKDAKSFSETRGSELVSCTVFYGEQLATPKSCDFSGSVFFDCILSSSFQHERNTVLIDCTFSDIPYIRVSNFQPVSIDMSNLDLEHFDLSDSRLKKVKFDASNMNFSKLSEGDFVDCSFTETELKGAQFVDCKFLRCSFIGCTFDVNTRFKNCKFEHIICTPDFEKYLPVGYSQLYLGGSYIVLAPGVSFNLKNLKDVSIRDISLRGANVSTTTFSNFKFTNVDMTNSVFNKASFDACTFNDVSLNGSQFTQIRFLSNLIKDSDVSLCILDSFVFINTSGSSALVNVNFTGSTFKICRFQGPCTIEDCSFEKSKIEEDFNILANVQFKNCNFAEADLKYRVFASANTVFEDCDFTSADLSGNMLTGCTFTDCVFVNCDISVSQLDYCDLTGCDFKSSKLKGSSIRYASLIDADLTDADLTGVDFYSTKYNSNTKGLTEDQKSKMVFVA